MFGMWKKSSHNHKKELFKKKFKNRGNHQLTQRQPDQNNTIDILDKKQPKPINNKHNHTECMQEAEQFYRTASQLTETNFNHHKPHQCLCNECQCGRHLCKMNVIKPNLTKSTVYQKSFY